MRLKFIILIAAILLPNLLHAQGAPVKIDPPAPGAQVYLCQYPPVGNPCTNQQPIYFDAALTVPITQPLQISATGETTFFTLGGTYILRVNGRSEKILYIGGGVNFGPALPATCTNGALFVNTSTNPPVTYVCGLSNVWTAVQGSTGLSGMTAGQVAIAANGTTVTSSKAIQGTSTNLLSSDGTGSPGSTFCELASGGATTGSTCTTLSGLTGGQVPIAGSANSATSSKAIQGTDAGLLSADSTGSTGAVFTKDANGGATTTPKIGTDTNIPSSGTLSGATGALTCKDANGGIDTVNCITGGVPAAPNYTGQFYNNGNLNSSQCSNLDILPSATTIRFDCDTRNKGPNPWIDITRYGARATNPYHIPSTSGINGTISSGSTALTLGSNSICTDQNLPSNACFQTGDGIDIDGAGAACGSAFTTQPGAPTVQPVGAAGGTRTGLNVAGATGATTYQYQYVVLDKTGCRSQASPATTITNGQASLGSRTLTISTITAVGPLHTLTFTGNHTLAVKQQFCLAGTSDDLDFSGCFFVASVPAGNQITYYSGNDATLPPVIPFTTPPGTTLSVSSATGGTAQWYNGNAITAATITGAWLYCFYGRTAGSNVFLGCGMPQSPGAAGGANLDPNFIDYGISGTGGLGGFPQPRQVPTAPPGSAITNSRLVTTITSVTGTSTAVTLANSASSNVCSGGGCVVRLDNTPNIVAAANAAQIGQVQNAPIYFPEIGLSGFTHQPQFVVNSYLLTPNNTTAVFALGPHLNDTWDMEGTAQLNGDVIPQGNGAISFQQTAGVSFYVSNEATVGVIIGNTGSCALSIRGLNFLYLDLSGSEPHGVTLMDVETCSAPNFLDVAFSSGSNASAGFDLGLIFRGTLSGTTGAFPVFMENITAVGGGQSFTFPGNNWTPVIYCQSCGLTVMKNLNLAQRGLAFSGNTAQPSPVLIEGGRIQGIAYPVFSGVNFNAQFNISHFESDTSQWPLVANLPYPNSPGSAGTTLTLRWAGCNQPGPLVTGNPIASIRNLAPFCVVTGQNHNILFDEQPINPVDNSNVGVVGALNALRFNEFVHFTGSQRLYFDLPTPAAPVASVAAGGSLSIGNHYIYVFSVGFDGGDGPISPPSNVCTTSSGNQTCSATFTPTTGATGYRCQLDGVTSSASIIAAGGPYTCSFASSTVVGVPAQIDASGGTTYFGNAEIGSPQYRFTASTGNSGFSGLLTTPTLTANRTYTVPDASGTLMLTTTPLGLNPMPLGAFTNYDNFNRANGGVGSNWTTVTGAAGGGLQISGNQITSQASATESLYTAKTFATDQFSEATATTASSGGISHTEVVRGTTASVTDYECIASGTSGDGIYKTSSGSFTLLSAGSVTISFVAGDVFRCEVSGQATTTLNMFKNGTNVATATDSSSPILSGFPGFRFGAGTGISSDNFNAGSLNPIPQLTVEQDWPQPQHFSAITVGPPPPVSGVLPIGTGYFNTVQTNGTNGGIGSLEGNGSNVFPAAQAGVDVFWPDSAGHRWAMNNNGTSKVYVTGTASQGVAGNIAIYAANGYDIVDSLVAGAVVDSTFTVGNATLVNAQTCTAPATVTMTGVTTGMTFDVTPTTDTSTVTGWGSPTANILYILRWPTSNTFNYRVCNNSAGNITTSASVTFNISAR